jgi:A/G-specific adenine glycosylase
MDFAGTIISWYIKNKRNLPWRETRDPYKIWLSEVILQQTRVQQGLSYYQSFTTKFPSVKKLAAAPESEVLKTWQGLGYYSRARNLHAAARSIISEQNGEFPSTYSEIIKLKGVGTYTAAAISSFCFNEAYPVIDGNVYRVLSRVFGIKTPIDSSAGKKEFGELAGLLLDRKNPGTYNQAIMEFGALQCVPKNPDCQCCPLFVSCEARKKKLAGTLPVKSQKTKVRDRFFNYLVMEKNGKLVLRKRTGGDIWQNLFDFPLIETAKAVGPASLIKSKDWKKMLGKQASVLGKISEPLKHVLSHQRIYIRFIEVKPKKKTARPEGWIEVDRQRLKRYAVPVPIQNYLEERLKRPAK